MTDQKSRTRADRAKALRAEALQAGLICEAMPHQPHHELGLDDGALYSTRESEAIRTLVELARKHAESDREGDHIGLLELSVDPAELAQWQAAARHQLAWKSPRNTRRSKGSKKRQSLAEWLEQEGEKPVLESQS
jgi:hypothetical protein